MEEKKEKSFLRFPYLPLIRDIRAIRGKKIPLRLTPFPSA